MIGHAAAHMAFWAVAFSVFVLGLRHGADPDHLAAIDNLTRNSLSVRNHLSRFAGALFAGGHSVMVLSIAALAGLLGSRISVHGALLETIGTWVSIATLFAIVALNLRQLAVEPRRSNRRLQDRNAAKGFARGHKSTRRDSYRLAVWPRL